MNARNMNVGDKVEFLSDLQTEKGPSCGSCIEKVGDYVVIKHSDNPGEQFDAEYLDVKKLTTAHDGKTLWMLV